MPMSQKFSSIMKSMFPEKSITPQLRYIMQLCHSRVELNVRALFNDLLHMCLAARRKTVTELTFTETVGLDYLHQNVL